MMKINKIVSRALFGVLGLLLMLNADALAGGGRDRAGTSAAPHLLIPVGARGTALSGAGMATISGIDAAFWNPAGLARSAYNADLVFSHMAYIADMNLEYVAGAVKFGNFGSLGFSVKSLIVGDINVTTEDQPDGTGEILSPNYLTIGAHYSKVLSDRVSVGFTTKIISESFQSVGSNGVAFDAGVQYRAIAGLEGLSIGVVLKDFGPAMTYGGSGLLRRGEVPGVRRPPSLVRIEAQPSELPTTLEIGTSYRYSLGETSMLDLSGVFQNNNFADNEFRFGAEWSLEDFVFLRGGYTIADEDDANPFIFGLTLGAGVSIQAGEMDLNIDYAFRNVDFLDNNHIFSLHLGF